MEFATNILLKQLRKQPRIGRAGETPEEGSAKEIQNKLETLAKKIPELTSLYETYTSVLKGVNTENAQLSQGLGQVIKFQESYKTQITSLYKSITYLEEQNKDLVKAFGLTSRSGQQLADNIRGLSDGLGVGDEKLFAYAKSLRALTGNMLTSKNVTTGYGKELMQARTIMRNNMDITDEAADGFELYAAGMGKSGLEMMATQEGLAKSIGKATGLDALAIQKDLTQEIGDLTADLQMRYNKIPGSLELAVLKSKALGMSMRELNSAGDNLLSIESSIGQELEYQLLSGKRLLTTDKKSLTDAYRRATLEGDASKQADLMNQLLVTQGDVLKNNMFARKKAAELMGMDEAAISKAIQKQEILTKLGKANLMSLSADKFAGELAKLEKEVAGTEKEKLFKELLKATDQRTTAERSEHLLEQIQTNTKLTASGGIDIGALQDTLINELKRPEKSFQALMKSFSDKTSMKLIGEVTNIGQVANALKTPLLELTKKLPMVGTVITTALDKLTKVIEASQVLKGVSTNDALIMPDRGPILRPAKNDVIAAFRPGDVIDRTLNSSGGKSAPIDYGKLAAAIASAMSNVTVEAKVKTDTLYAATKLNGPRRFGQA